MERAAESAATLTSQLPAFSRKQLIEPKVLDLNSVIDRSQKMLRRLITEDIELLYLPSADKLPVKMDPGQVEQILINLAVNARDAMPKGGLLTLETQGIDLSQEQCRLQGLSSPGEYVCLSITDNGLGMDEEIRTHLFEPFFTRKDKGKGTRLGLATVYGAIRQNQGSIEVFSEPGQGSAFRIYLPRVQTEVEEMPRILEERVYHGTETILVVEDEPMVRNLAKVALQHKGYQVQAFPNGHAALEEIQNRTDPIHLLLTEVIMPDLDGKSLVDAVRKIRPDIKVLFTSGYTDDLIAHHGVLEEAIHFIGKPYTPVRLAQKVREVLDGE